MTHKAARDCTKCGLEIEANAKITGCSIAGCPELGSAHGTSGQSTTPRTDAVRGTTELREHAEQLERDLAAQAAYWKQRTEWAEGQPGAKRPFTDQLAQEVIAGQVKEIDRLTDMVKELRDVQSESSSWISVSERTPETSGWYHVWTDGPHDPLRRHGTATAYFYSVPPPGWRLLTGEGEITHWMPLPTAPHASPK